MKGDISAYAIFVVILIGASIAVILAVTYHWINNILPTQGNQFFCSIKLLNYCTEFKKAGWDQGKVYTYKDANPKTCEEFTKVNDQTGPDRTKCEELLGLK